MLRDTTLALSLCSEPGLFVAYTSCSFVQSRKNLIWEKQSLAKESGLNFLINEHGNANYTHALFTTTANHPT